MNERIDWIEPTILSTVLGELKRAKRVKEEEQIFRETARTATRANLLQALLQVAIQRDDIDIARARCIGDLLRL